MSEQPNTTSDLTPVAVPDSSSPTVAELEAKIAELESASKDVEDAKSVEDEPEAAVFRATTDDNAPAAATADPAPAPVATDSVPATADSGSVVPASDVPSSGLDAAARDAATAQDVNNLVTQVGEIHQMISELHGFIQGLEPVFEDIQKNGLGSLLGGLFGGRR